MRLLTILPPWSTLIAEGRKPVENRGARMGKAAKKFIGERVAIHSGKTDVTPPNSTAPDGRPWPSDSRPGHVVAVAVIDRVEPPVTIPGPSPTLDPFRDPDSWGIYFRDVVPLAEPVPVKGGQGWRHLEKLDPAAYESVMAQLEAAPTTQTSAPTSQLQPVRLIDTEGGKPLDPWSSHPRRVPTSQVKVPRRTRKDLGDIEAFAARMKAVGGQLEPIVVDPDMHLIAGERRLRACEHLGWDVDIVVTASAKTEFERLDLEWAENNDRKDFTPEERLRYAERRLELERAAAGERRRAGAAKGGRGGDDDAPSSGSQDPKLGSDEGGRAEARAAEAAGLGGRKTLQAVRQIVQAAEADPERHGDLLRELNAGGKPKTLLRRLKNPAWDKDSWCTDEEILAAVHRFWPGGVALDPCANEWSKKLGFVRADVAWTIDDDALAQAAWCVPSRDTTCWYQPPYGDPLPLTKRLAAEWDARHLDEVLALVKLDTSTEWWLLLEERAIAVVFFHHRLAHYAGDQRVKGSDFCSAMLLLTEADDIEERIEALREAFEPLGARVMRVMRRPEKENKTC